MMKNGGWVWLITASLLISTCSRSTAQSGSNAEKPWKTSRGLHATLSGRAETSNGPPFESLTFRLINDSEQPMSSSTRTWTLVIDGREWPESQNMFNNGGRPGGGYDTVPPRCRLGAGDRREDHLSLCNGNYYVIVPGFSGETVPCRPSHPLDPPGNSNRGDVY